MEIIAHRGVFLFVAFSLLAGSCLGVKRVRYICPEQQQKHEEYCRKIKPSPTCGHLINCFMDDCPAREKPQTRPYPKEIGDAYNQYRLKKESEIENAILSSFKDFGLTYVTLTDSSAIDNSPNWRRSGWLGNFYQSNKIWMYHEHLGGIFPKRSGEGFWLWREGLNWIWTKQGVFPFIYSSDLSTWMYFYGLNRGGIAFYQYSNSSIIIVP